MKKIVGLFLMGIFLSGCVAVTSQNQLGTKVTKLEPGDWDGVWSNGKDQVFYVKVKDAEKGILRVAAVEYKKDDFKLHSFDAMIKEGDNLKFANILVKDIVDKDEDELKDLEYADSYFWMLIENKNDNIMLFFPDAKKIEELIAAGTLKGLKKKNAFILQGSSEDLTKFAESSKTGELFYWKEPLPLIKILNDK